MAEWDERDIEQQKRELAHEWTKRDIEQQEYELAVDELDQLVRLYARWDDLTDKLARLAISKPINGIYRNELRREMQRLKISAHNLLPYTKSKFSLGVVERPKPPKPGELGRLLLERIVKLYMRLPGREPGHIEPEHIFTLFDRAGVPRPVDRGRIQRAVKKLEK